MFRAFCIALSSLPAIVAVSDERTDKPGTSRNKPEFLQLSQKLEQAAKAIRIDGLDSDWQQFPVFSDHDEESDSDKSRDITEIAIAPRAKDLLVLIRTAGDPSREDRAFWLDVDMWQFQTVDFRIGIASARPSLLWIYEHESPPKSASIFGIEVAISKVVEIRIPYQSLEDAYAQNDKKFPKDAYHRWWTRILPFSWDSANRKQLDHGPAVASPKFPYVQTENSESKENEPAKSVILPVKEKWYLTQGAFGILSHQNQWAYDLHIVDHTLHASRVRNSQQNEDYYSWNQPVYAPSSARVIRAQNDKPDRQPSKKVPPQNNETRPNEVYLTAGRGIGLQLVHMRQGSVRVRSRGRVRAGKRIGAVGNSGRTSDPHLHMALWKLPEGKQTLPMAFRNVKVSLNWSDDDPWAQEYKTWIPREGFFVQRRVATQRQSRRN